MTEFIIRQKISGDMSDDNIDNWNDLFISKEDHEKKMKESFNKGYKKALDDHHILHGKNADKFLKETGLDKSSR